MQVKVWAVLAAGPVAFAAGAMIASPAMAQDKPPEPKVMRVGASGNIFVLWSSASVSPPPGERRVAKGEYLFKQPLKPSGLAKPDADVSDASGRVVIPAGTVLTKVERLWTMYCWLNEAAIAENGGKAPCVTDGSDRGSFDRLFYQEAAATGLPSVRDRIPRDLATIPPVRYAVLPLEQWTSPYFIGLRFLGWRGWPGMGPLFAHIGGPRFETLVVGGSRVRKNKVPAIVDVDGATLEIAKWDDAELVATVRSVFKDKRVQRMAGPAQVIYVPVYR